MEWINLAWKTLHISPEWFQLQLTKIALSFCSRIQKTQRDQIAPIESVSGRIVGSDAFSVDEIDLMWPIDLYTGYSSLSGRKKTEAQESFGHEITGSDRSRVVSERTRQWATTTSTQTTQVAARCVIVRGQAPSRCAACWPGRLRSDLARCRSAVLGPWSPHRLPVSAWGSSVGPCR